MRLYDKRRILFILSFNPRTPCGVRPRGGRRTFPGLLCFNPRTPCGVRHANLPPLLSVRGFNPRTPCGVRLVLPKSSVIKSYGFNPRTPCGVRQKAVVFLLDFDKFQSTHSLRSATYYEEAGRYAYIVSIHALLAECDRRGHFVPRPVRSFNPRTPCGVRQSGLPDD